MEETLYHAVSTNNVEKLRELIENGADVDEVYTDFQNISTKSVLHICCEKGRVECAQILADAGAFLNIHDKWGQTPLMYCMTVQYPEIARILLEHDPDLVHHADVYGKSPLHCASECDSIEGVELLLEYGADIDVQNNAGLTPLMTCVTSYNVEDHVRMAKVLLNAGPDINKRDYRSKRTVLHHAVLTKRTKLVEMFLEAGADVNILDGSGKTALTCIMSEYIRPHTNFEDINPDVMAIIIILLQAGTDINLTICEPSNALITAIFLQIEPLVRFFICEGAIIDIQFATTVTPLVAAVSRSSIAILRTLLEWNCDLYPQTRIYKKRTDMEYMFDACQLALDQGRLDMVKVLVGAGYQFSASRQAYLYPDALPVPKKREYGNLNAYLWNNEGQMDAVVPESLCKDPEMLEWVTEEAHNPRSLLSFAVITIRRTLGREVTQAVPSLPIPSRMQDQVLLRGIL